MCRNETEKGDTLVGIGVSATYRSACWDNVRDVRRMLLDDVCQEESDSRTSCIGRMGQFTWHMSACQGNVGNLLHIFAPVPG